MLNVDRDSHPAPACLSDERADAGREALSRIFSMDAAFAAQTSFSMAPSLVQDHQLQTALESLFRGRCAFCESEAPTRAYRFRPSEEAGPASQTPRKDADRAHLYYAWLANAWDNIYPVCSGCLPKEPSIFPIFGLRRRLPDDEEIRLNIDKPSGNWISARTDNAVFLDPCEGKDFRKHLAALPGGALLGLGERGRATITHFNLDRPELQGRRAYAFDIYRHRLFERGREEAVSSTLDFRNLEFGGAWFLLLYQLARKLGGGGVRPALSINRIHRYYADRLADDDFADLFEEAWFDLLERPDQLLTSAGPAAPPNRGDVRPRSFEIENFKALEQVHLELPPPAQISSATGQESGSVLVILGENAAGKSSLLEAMALSLVDQPTRDDLSQDARSFMLSPRLMGAPESPQPRRGHVSVRYENGLEATMGVRPGFPALNGGDIPRLPVFAYGAFRLYLSSDKRVRRSSPIRSLFEPGYVLPNPEQWLASLYADERNREQFNDVARRLKIIFGLVQPGEVLVVQRGKCFLRVAVDRPGLPPLEQLTPLSLVSSGFRSVLAMACDIMRGLIAIQDRYSATLANSRAVVLVDEIEAHLHPRWKMRIVQALREALPNVTFILTTHDPLCLRGLHAREVMVFRRVQRDVPGELPVVVEQLEELPEVGSLSIEQILTSDFFQLFSTDGPVIEARFARAADLLAMEKSDRPLSEDDRATLRQVRADISDQIRNGMPVGSTEIERLIQEAVEDYLARRRHERAAALGKLRRDTREKIANILEGL